MPKSSTMVTIDPSLQYERSMHYREKHSGWEIFKSVYWGLYIFTLGLVLMASNPANFVLANFVGMAFVLFSIFFIVYGFSVSLHLKLIKRYG